MKKLMFLLFGFISLNTYAIDPTYDATKGALQNDPSLCSYGYNPNCNRNNSAPQQITTPKVINIPSKYGAVATDEKSGATGGSINMTSLAAAKKAAVEQCREGKKGRSCKVIAWVRNGCFAVAQGKKGSKFVLSKATEKEGKAEQIAIQRCISSGASNCQILIPEACSIP